MQGSVGAYPAYSLNKYAICRTAVQVFLPPSHEYEAAQLLLTARVLL